MKMSNKLLLGGFLTLILLVTGMHIALYAKYKNGHYTIYQPGERDGQPAMKSFPNVSVITIRNVGGANIVFGDMLAVENDEDAPVHVLQQGDSVVITGGNEDGRFAERNRVELILPHNVTLSVFNSEITFDKGKDNPRTNPNIFLYNSHATFAVSRTPIQLGYVMMTSDNSIAAFRGNTQVNHLEVQLKNSSLEYNEGDIGQLSIATDSASRLMLQSKHLLKAKITTISNNP